MRFLHQLNVTFGLLSVIFFLIKWILVITFNCRFLKISCFLCRLLPVTELFLLADSFSTVTLHFKYPGRPRILSSPCFGYATQPSFYSVLSDDRLNCTGNVVTHQVPMVSLLYRHHNLELTLLHSDESKQKSSFFPFKQTITHTHKKIKFLKHRSRVMPYSTLSVSFHISPVCFCTELSRKAQPGLIFLNNLGLIVFFGH